MSSLLEIKTASYRYQERGGWSSFSRSLLSKLTRLAGWSAKPFLGAGRRHLRHITRGDT